MNSEHLNEVFGLLHAQVYVQFHVKCFIFQDFINWLLHSKTNNNLAKSIMQLKSKKIQREIFYETNKRNGSKQTYFE